MGAADRLIVALDLDSAIDASYLAGRLAHEAGVRFFKLGPAALMDRYGLDLIEDLAAMGVDLMLDLKSYDTRDTVERTVSRAFSLGARFVTVHATPSVMAAAMRAKPADARTRVLAVGPLTDRPYSGKAWVTLSDALKESDGVICPRVYLPSFRAANGARISHAEGKLLVTPGIRPVLNDGDYDAKDNHAAVATPTEALRAGADYLVVGRPITRAPDPVAAARAILEEMASVG